MVKIKGPALSLDASGTIADTLTFSTWKGKATLRKRTTPKNPKTGAQVGKRTMLSWLSKQWSALSTNDKETWNALADATKITPYSAYVGFNQKQWHHDLLPTKTWPTDRILNPSKRTLAITAWEEHRIKLSTSDTDLRDGWGMIFHASLTSPMNLDPSTAIFAKPTINLDWTEYFWTPPSVATWYFKSRTFSNDGKPSLFSSQRTAAPP